MPLGRGCPSCSTWLGLAARHAAAQLLALQALGITISRLDAKRWARAGGAEVAGAGLAHVEQAAGAAQRGGGQMWGEGAGAWEESSNKAAEVMQSQK